MKKTYILIIICMAILSYFGTRLVTNINDYSVQKSLENKRKNNVPIIEVVSEDVTISQNANIDYSKFLKSATDEEDGDLTSNVTHNDIDSTKIGTQNIVYSVTDSDGNTATKTVRVTIEGDNSTDNSSEEEHMEQS